MPHVEANDRPLNGSAVRLEEAHALLAAIVESSDDAIVSEDLDGIIRSWNRGAERMFGYTAAEAIGYPMSIVALPGRRNEMPEVLARIRAGRPVEHFETERRRKDGTGVTVSVSMSPVRNAAGEVVGVSHIARDVSDGKRETEALLRSEAELRLVLDSAPARIAHLNREGRYVRVNRAYEEWFDLKPEEIQGRTMEEALGVEQFLELRPYVDRVLGGEPVQFEMAGAKRCGELRHLSVSYTPHVDATGQVLGFVALVQDITDRKRIEEELRASNAALRESEDHYRHTMELNPQVPWTASPDGQVEDISCQWEVLTGLGRERALGRGWIEVLHPEDSPGMLQTWEHSLRTGEPFDREHRIRVADRSYRWMRTRARARLDGQGRRVRWYGSTADIHGRKLADQELEAAYQQFDAVFSASPLPVVALTRAGSITLWNPAAERVFGWSAEEVMGRPLPFIPADKLEEHRLMRARDLSGQGISSQEIARRRKDGRQIDLSVSTAPLTDASGEVSGIMSVYLDITEQKRAEAARAAVERQLMLLVEASGSLIASPQSSQVLPTVVELAQRFIAADAYAVWREGPNELWRAVSTAGLSEEFVRGGTAAGRGTPALSTEPLTIEDVEGEVRLEARREALLNEGLRSMLVVPLQIHGRINGTVVFYWKTKRRFGQAEVRVAAALGNLAASALGTADMYEAQLHQHNLAQASERRAAFLAEASAVLASSLDYRTTLASVAQLAVPAFADWAAVDVVDAGGELQRVAVAHTDPERVRFAYEFSTRYPARERDASRVALRSGQSVLIPKITDETIDRSARDAEHARLIRQLGLRSCLIVPVKLAGRSLGLITFGTAESGRHYGEPDLQTAEEIARRAATAIEHAGLYRNVQHSEERYRSLVSATTSVVWTVDPDGRFIEAQPSWQAYTGQAWEQYRDFGWLDAIHPEDREAFRERWAESRRQEKTHEWEARLWHAPNGQYRHFNARAVAVRNEEGTVREWVGTITDVEERNAAEQERASLLLREKDARQTAELLNRVGPVLAAELDTQKLAQSVTDIATRLTGAEFGALFHNVSDETGESYMLYTLAGVDAQAFAGFPMPRNTEVFGPTFRNEGPVRSEDITRDPRYGKNAPHQGMPAGHLPVRSYLAVPVVSRSGEVLGGLLFGHSETSRFTEAHEQVASGIAAQAAIALDNARLFSESQRVQQDLMDTNERLRRANSDLEQFAYSASHDLKEPLRMVAIYSQVLQRRYRGRLDADADEYLGFTMEGAKRMEALLADLLAYTQVVNGTEETVGLVDGEEALSHALANLRAAMEESGAQVEWTSMPKLQAQQAHVVLLFQNLIANAIKYRAEEPPAVKVSAARDGKMWRLCVHDNGIGIAPEYRERVFGLFKRLHNSERYSGTGIGLALCQKIVHRYGGRIWVESGGDRQGSTFCFTLPGRGGDAAGETP